MRYKLLRYARYIIQLSSLILFVLLFSKLVYPVEWPAGLLQWFTRLDPWGLLDYIRLQHTVPAWVWLPLLVLMVTILFGRVFCGWLCPFGAFFMLTDKISRLLMKLKFFRKAARFKEHALAKLLPFRYLWLLFLAIIFIFGSGLVYFITPFALFSHEIVRIYREDIPWILIGLILITVFFSRLWCSVFCPTGLLLSLLGKIRLFRIQVNGSCVNCKKCTHSCPVGAAPADSGAAKEGCLVCGECQIICPTKTIKYLPYSHKYKKNNVTPEAAVTTEKYIPTRRQFFKIAGTAIVAAAFTLTGKIALAANKVLRPPGALKEADFLSLCNRCGRCIKVCPNNALQPMSILDGLESFETPHIIPRKSSCSLCLSCQEVCPTGAIRKLPLEQLHMGQAVIDRTRCLAWRDNKQCYICGEQCPVVAITGDDQHRPYLDLNKCVGCGSCERACPVEGEAAIRVTPR